MMMNHDVKINSRFRIQILKNLTTGSMLEYIFLGVFCTIFIIICLGYIGCCCLAISLSSEEESNKSIQEEQNLKEIICLLRIVKPS